MTNQQPASEGAAEQPSTKPDAATRAAERREAEQPHSAGRGPTADEALHADSHEARPDVAQHYREMTERGAHVEGEGDVAPDDH